MPQESESRSLDKVIVRLPDGMRDRLRDAAAAAKRSMNAEIVARIEDGFAIDGMRRALKNQQSLFVDLLKAIVEDDGDTIDQIVEDNRHFLGTVTVDEFWTKHVVPIAFYDDVGIIAQLVQEANERGRKISPAMQVEFEAEGTERTISMRVVGTAIGRRLYWDAEPIESGEIEK